MSTGVIGDGTVAPDISKVLHDMLSYFIEQILILVLFCIAAIICGFNFHIHLNPLIWAAWDQVVSVILKMLITLK